MSLLRRFTTSCAARGQSNNLSMANQNLTDHDVLALLPVIDAWLDIGAGLLAGLAGSSSLAPLVSRLSERCAAHLCHQL